MGNKIYDINWYLQNTTIYGYYEYILKDDINIALIPDGHYEDIYKDTYIIHTEYFLRLNYDHFLDIESFTKFVDEKIKEYNIKDYNYMNIFLDDDLSNKLEYIDRYIFEKLNKLITLQESQSIESVFKNAIDFIKKYKNCTFTDWENFYKALWSDTINWNTLKQYNASLNNNINRFRETRNKFFEHLKDTDRKVEYLEFNDDMLISITLTMLSNWKKYEIFFSPLLDFALFIDSFLEITKNLE